MHNTGSTSRPGLANGLRTEQSRLDMTHHPSLNRSIKQQRHGRVGDKSLKNRTKQSQPHPRTGAPQFSHCKNQQALHQAAALAGRDHNCQPGSRRRRMPVVRGTATPSPCLPTRTDPTPRRQQARRRHFSRGTATRGCSRPPRPCRRMARRSACGSRSSRPHRHRQTRPARARRCWQTCSSSRTGRQSATCTPRRTRASRTRRGRWCGGRRHAARGARRGCG